MVRTLLLTVLILSVLGGICFAILKSIMAEPERYDAGIKQIMLEVSNQYTYSLPNSEYSQQAQAYRIGKVNSETDSVSEQK